MGSYPSKDIVAEAKAAPEQGRGHRFDDAGRALRRGALIVDVDPESPADDAGFEPGCRIVSVDGLPLRDLIDWRWLSADDVITLGYIDLDGECGEVELVRDEGEPWGFSFEGAVFDGVRQCRNACTFCFMRQLPSGMRPSLTVRDDDFRLSFLAGTFVTLTNLTPGDEERIIDQRISPLRVSLHASDPDVRRSLMGKHADHGLAAFDRLLAAGIEAHTQIVLVPGCNDGAALERTLQWAWERPGILDVGIVPLGYTRHQSAFDHSFNEPQQARAVLDAIASFQKRARAERGGPWVFAADEFYRNAYREEVLKNLPPASDYGDFSMFEDGIGILRSCADDWRDAVRSGVADRCARALVEADAVVYYVAGCALRETFPALVAESPLGGLFKPLFVENRFFGGNVDVTGLLCGRDIVAAIRAVSDRFAPSRVPDGPSEASDALSSVERTAAGGAGAPSKAGMPRGASSHALFLLPRVIFNDDGETLDGWTLEDVKKAAGCPVSVVSCTPTEYLGEAAELAGSAFSL